VAIEGFDGSVLPEGQTVENSNFESELSSQAVLANTTGFIVYIRNNPASTPPWQIYRYDQAGNQSLKVFEGTREIQSVAISGDGNTVLATMRATTTAGSPFDVLSLHPNQLHNSPILQQTSRMFLFLLTARLWFGKV
jgi:hypothetical protein